MELIKSDVLEQLKCSVCDKYLSYGPVQLQENGNNVCGRCSVPEGMKAFRMMPYEHLAKDHSFSCQYEENGCKIKVKFSEMKSHEYVCEFRPVNCPILEECEWSGLAHQFVDHYKQKHPKNVLLANPATLEHDITKSNSRIFVMVALGSPFLIYTKICVESGNIYHSVQQFVGSSNEPITFDMIISNANGELRRKGNVAIAENAFVLENHAVIVDINGLIKILGRIKGTTFQININKPTMTTPVANIETFQQHIRPVIIPWFFENDLRQSRSFFTDKKKCNRVNCNYNASYYDLVKHKYYYCKDCYICSKRFVVTMSIHFKKNHSIYTTENMILTKGVTYEKLHLSLPFFDDVVHLIYKMTDSYFFLRVYTPIPKSYLSSYKFQVTFVGPMNKTYEKELPPIKDHVADWAIAVDIENANVTQIRIALKMRSEEQASLRVEKPETA